LKVKGKITPLQNGNEDILIHYSLYFGVLLSISVGYVGFEVLMEPKVTTLLNHLKHSVESQRKTSLICKMGMKII